MYNERLVTYHGNSEKERSVSTENSRQRLGGGSTELDLRNRNRSVPGWVGGQGLPRWLSGKESACQCEKWERFSFDP